LDEFAVNIVSVSVNPLCNWAQIEVPKHETALAPLEHRLPEIVGVGVRRRSPLRKRSQERS